MRFLPEEGLIEGKAAEACRACVVLPARNEEESLRATLEALAAQVDVAGRPLPKENFEILLLLNNCTDRSAAVAAAWAEANPGTVLHVIARELPEAQAHIGTARRLLMDTAWRRLRRAGDAILSTDADTEVAPDWIARNLCAMDAGADAVGGVIELKRGDLERLPLAVRQAYTCDRRYQMLVAALEDLCDPQAADRWPRHLEHFGASLGCTREVYARAGGMPAIARLEDVAFVDRLRRVDARLRHDPEVVVWTSSRMEGRVETGLSEMLRTWETASAGGESHRVPTAAWLRHRFCTLRWLRDAHAGVMASDEARCSAAWMARIAEARAKTDSVGEFLAEVDCDRLIEETFCGTREDDITAACAELATMVGKGRAEHAIVRYAAV